MAKQLPKLVMLVLFLLAFFCNPVLATTEKGDTLVIHQADQDLMPWNEIVSADTNSDGTHAHAVYELDPNSWYPVSGQLVFNEDMTIIGGKRTSETDTRPWILTTDPWTGWYMLGGSKNITLKGLHMMQMAETVGGNISAWARSGMQLTGENSKVVVEDCIWDFNTGFALNMTKNGLNLEVRNCLFRFSKPTDNSVWAGQGIDISSAQLDTVIIQNCTWYGGGPFMLKTWASTEKYFKMDHCSIIDFAQWPLHGVQWVNSVFTNNLFYNAYTMGEDRDQILGQDPDGLPFGVMDVDTTFYDVDTVITGADTVINSTVNWTKETARNLLVSNNNNFIKQNIMDYWAVAMSGDTIYHDFVAPDPADYHGFINKRTKAMFENDATWPGLVLQNTTTLDPQFASYFDYSDTLINYSKAYYSYAWPNAKKTQFMLDPDGEPLQPTDPMVYNLKVNNASLRSAATDGGVIGDLTWELPNGYNSIQADIATDVKRSNLDKPSEFALNQNYPNPFNPSTVITFSLAKESNVTLNVYNIIGQKVATLVNKRMGSGNYEYKFDASNLGSGVYIYRLETDNFSVAKKMMLIK